MKTTDTQTLTRNTYSWSVTEREEFVRVWQRAKSIEEVTRTLGINKHLAQRRAIFLRQHGVGLKKFRIAGFDYEPLKQLAKQLLRDEER